MNDTFTMQIRVVQDADVCILSMETQGFEHIQGSSKRHPADDRNPVIGQCVAFGRLFNNLATHYDQVVDALMQPPVIVEEPTEMDVAEALWFEKYNVPPQEMMGDNQRDRQ